MNRSISEQMPRILPHLLTLPVYISALFAPLWMSASVATLIFIAVSLFQHSENGRKREWLESAWVLFALGITFFLTRFIPDFVLMRFAQITIVLVHVLSVAIAITFLLLENRFRYLVSPVSPFFTEMRVAKRQWRREFGKTGADEIAGILEEFETLRRKKNSEGLPETLSLFQSIALFGRENPKTLLKHAPALRNYLTVYRTIVKYDSDDAEILKMRETLKEGLRHIDREVSLGAGHDKDGELSFARDLLDRAKSL